MSRAELLKTAIESQLSPSHLEIVDESHQHAGNRVESHFRIVVVSEQFDGMPLLARHRAVQDPVRSEFQQGLHALALHTYTPAEWAKRGAAPDSPQCRGGSQ